VVQTTSHTRLNKRLEILVAASAVFRELGFHRAGMREIASRLGVAVGQLYYYFESKEHLLNWCQENSLQSLLRMDAHVGARASNASEKLFGLIYGHLACLHQWFPGSLAHLEITPGSKDDRLLHLRNQYEACMVNCIEEGIRDREFECEDSKLQALTVLGAMNWTTRWFRQEKEWSLLDLAKGIGIPILRGLRGSSLVVVDPHYVAEWFSQFDPMEWNDE
jgi:AcrR family transcriptional regulator